MVKVSGTMLLFVLSLPLKRSQFNFPCREFLLYDLLTFTRLIFCALRNLNLIIIQNFKYPSSVCY